MGRRAQSLSTEGRVWEKAVRQLEMANVARVDGPSKQCGVEKLRVERRRDVKSIRLSGGQETQRYGRFQGFMIFGLSISLWLLYMSYDS